MSTWPAWAHTQCINSALDHAVCTNCVAHCPAEAIHMRAGQPMLDTDSCTGCTACIPVCPTSAIHYPAHDAEVLLAHISGLPVSERRRLCIHCHADSSTNMTIHCHAGWHAQHFAILASMGVQMLILSGTQHCDTCSLRFGATALEQTCGTYAELKRATETTVHVQVEAVTDKAEQPTGSGPASPSRRAFFRDFIPSMLSGAAAAVTPDNDEHTHTEPTDIFLPTRHQQFVIALKRLQPNFTPVPASPRLGLGAIQASETCTACHACVEACPSKALDLKPFGHHQVLYFSPETCTGCSLCIEHCDVEALEALPAVSLPAMAARQPRPLVMVRHHEQHVSR